MRRKECTTLVSEKQGTETVGRTGCQVYQKRLQSSHHKHFTELKETMVKWLRKGWVQCLINNEIEIILKRTKGKFWSWKIRYLKFFKSPLEGLHSRAELTGERINEHEDSLVAIVYDEEQKGKIMKKHEGCLRENCGTIKNTSTLVMGTLEGERKEQKLKKSWLKTS